MRGEIDRIEDGKYAVIYLETGAELVVPAASLGFSPREGQHLKIHFTPDPVSQDKSRKRIKGIQKELLQRTGERDNKDNKKKEQD